MWLLKEDVLSAVESARISGAGLLAAQMVAFAERNEPTADGIPRNLKIAGNVAEIRVEGVLTRRPDFFSWLFGGGNTTYEQIQTALQVCASDPSIEEVVFRIHSPGGHVDGLFDALAAIDAFPKKKRVVAAFACSAAYAIAAMGGKIEVTNSAVEVGSIGTAIRFQFYDDITTIDITNTESPDKRPDVKTEAGRAVIREHLDAVNELFVEAIAKGRGTTVKRVTESFGRGKTMLATEAKKLGMVDKISASTPRTSDTDAEPEDPDDSDEQPDAAVAAENETHMSMTKELLKKDHRETYDAILEEGRAEGQSKERKRVQAHLTLGTKSGSMKIAVDAIASGASPQDDEVFAAYQSAAMDRRDVAARQSDSADAGAAVDGAKPPAASAGAKDFGDLVADAMDLPPAKA